MINWTEEDVKFICESMIMPAMQEAMKVMDKSNDSLTQCIGIVTDTLAKLASEQRKENYFFRAFIMQQLHMSQEEFYAMYHNWCSEYDKENASNG